MPSALVFVADSYRPNGYSNHLVRACIIHGIFESISFERALKPLNPYRHHPRYGWIYLAFSQVRSKWRTSAFFSLMITMKETTWTIIFFRTQECIWRPFACWDLKGPHRQSMKLGHFFSLLRFSDVRTRGCRSNVFRDQPKKVCSIHSVWFNCGRGNHGIRLCSCHEFDSPSSQSDGASRHLPIALARSSRLIEFLGWWVSLETFTRRSAFHFMFRSSAQSFVSEYLSQPSVCCLSPRYLSSSFIFSTKCCGVSPVLHFWLIVRKLLGDSWKLPKIHNKQAETHYEWHVVSANLK